MVEYLLNLLDLNFIATVYIGITGILIAIVIFMAEIVKEQSNELNKKLIVNKSKIKEDIIFMICILAYMIFCNAIKYDNSKLEYDWYNILFIMIHLILIFCVIISTFTTIRLIIVAFRLNTNKKYFNEKLEEYVQDRVINISKIENKKMKRITRKERAEFDIFIKTQNFFEAYHENKLSDEYVPIYAKNNGVIEKFDYERMNNLSSSFYASLRDGKELNTYDKSPVYLVNCVGKKIKNNDVLCYCLKQYENYFSIISDLIYYLDDKKYINDEISIINDGLISLALKYERPYKFDENDMLYNYFLYLYDNDLYDVRKLAFYSLEEKIRDGKYYNKKRFISFLNHIALTALDKNEYDDYEYLTKVLSNMYIIQLNSENADVKQVSFDFCVNIIKNHMFMTKKKQDIRFYEQLMAILFGYLIAIIKSSLYSSIQVILENIFIEDNMENEWSQYDTVKFQFCCGVVYCLMQLVSINKLDVNNIDDINELITFLKDEFINIYDIYDFINIFRGVFHKETNLSQIYGHFDFDFIDHRYKSTWTVNSIDERMILREMIYIFNIDFVDFEAVDFNCVDKSDRYYYESLLKNLKEDKETELEKIMNIHYDDKNVVQLVDMLLSEANRKEAEYNKTNSMSKELINEFKNSIYSEIGKNSELISAMNLQNRKINENIKNEKVLGINQLIPREVFFSDNPSSQFFSTEFSKCIEKSIENNYIDFLNGNIHQKEVLIDNALKDINEKETYVILSNYRNLKYLKKYGYSYNKNTLLINKNEIEIINIPQLADTYLIKKDKLPMIELCGYDDKWNKDSIDGNYYFELNDCSSDEELRRELIENSKWLKEKGTEEEQDEYLKECCRVLVYYSYRIKKTNHLDLIKIKLE